MKAQPAPSAKPRQASGQAEQQRLARRRARAAPRTAQRPRRQRRPTPRPASRPRPAARQAGRRTGAIPAASSTGSHSSQRRALGSSIGAPDAAGSGQPPRAARHVTRSRAPIPSPCCTAAPICANRPAHLAPGEGHNINHECSCQVRSFADWLSAHRRRADRAVQLAVRPPPRRPLPAAHRGHRPAALHAGRDRGDLRRPGLARARCRRAAGVPVRARRDGMPRSRNACSPRARPIAAGPRPRSWRRCAPSQRAQGLPMRYDGRWRDRDPSEAPAGRRAGDPAARRRRPASTRIADMVQGEIEVANEQLDDMVLLRGRRHADLHAVGGGRRHRHGQSPMSSAATTT